MITNNLRITLRNKVSVIINVLGLLIAIACCIVAYLNLDFNRSFDHHHVNTGDVYRIQAWHHYQDQHSRYAVVPHALGAMLSLFGVVVITVGYKTMMTVFMNPVHTLKDE